ncbi:MAG: hypothetical protein K2Q32_03535 [Alphaproteobacteria bacterium]|nr:hypothetical protein [Alphaproteobacteria bacterium]
MPMPEINSAEKKTDIFEILVTCCLGMAAIGIALSGFEGGLWNSASIEAYTSANKTATQASKIEMHAAMNVFHDMEIDAQAKEKIVEAIDAPDADTRERDLHFASYLLSAQLSDAAYKELQLPQENHAGTIKTHEAIPEKELDKALDRHLGDAFEEKMLAQGNALFDKAEQRFEDGRKASSTGDRFALVGVILSISLFFSGLALVFKNKLRWYLLAGGAAIVIYGVTTLAFIPFI